MCIFVYFLKFIYFNSIFLDGAVTTNDKKQLSSLSSSIILLRGKTMAGEVDAVIIDKLAQLVTEIQNKNSAGANTIQMVR